MVEGSIKQGAYLPLQMGFLRPNEDCSRYRTPVKNLYLAGASSYPGGLITFGPGYNAANAIAEDLHLDKWWKEPEFLVEARRKGLLD
jgi:phytoene dehydrogenase-like protein